MKPTKEQLKDPQWWSENAPEGAEALIDDDWIKWVDGVEMFLSCSGEWAPCCFPWSLQNYMNNKLHEVYKRPEPAWQPKVGDVCLARVCSDNWQNVELLKLGRFGRWVCYFETEESQHIFLSDKLKPLPKTPREQFIEAAIDRFGLGPDAMGALYDLAMEFK